MFLKALLNSLFHLKQNGQMDKVIIRTTRFCLYFLSIAAALVSCVNDKTIGNRSETSDDEIGKKAISLYYEGNYAESIKLLSYSIEEHPRVAELRFWQAKNFAAINEFQSAIDSYSGAISIDSNKAKYFNNRGLVYLAIGSHNAAESDFRKAIELDSLMPEVMNNMGLLYSEKGEYYKAINEFSNALRIEPMTETYLYNRAVNYINAGEFFKAIDDFNQVIELNDQNGNAFLYRGVSRYQTDQINLACDDFAMARSLNIDDAKEYLEHCKDF